MNKFYLQTAKSYVLLAMSTRENHYLVKARQQLDLYKKTKDNIVFLTGYKEVFNAAWNSYLYVS